MPSPQVPDSVPSSLAEELLNQDNDSLEDTRDYIDQVLTYRRQTDENENDSEEVESTDDAGPKERDRTSQSG